MWVAWRYFNHQGIMIAEDGFLAVDEDLHSQYEEWSLEYPRNAEAEAA